MDRNKFSTMIDFHGWRFNYDGGMYIEVESMEGPEYKRISVQAPHFMRHSDLEMFARGWVADADNVR